MNDIFVILLALVSSSFCKLSFEELKREWELHSQIAENWERPTENVEFRNFSKNITDHGYYDFVVIGGGSSGAVIANRLSEIKKWTVLLIEAGEDENKFGRIPGAHVINSLSKRNWGYLTTPQLHACNGCKKKQCDFTSGKVLGGSSSINAMIYVRGNRRDFKRWNSDQWSFEKVLPYFLKLENASSFSDNEKYRGQNGPVTIEHPIPEPLFAQDIIKAYNDLGVKAIDYNAIEQIGVSLVQGTINTACRSSTNSAYLLREVLKRPNLKVFKSTLAIKILIKKSKAIGVLFIKGGSLGKVLVKKEIVVSGGSINSPQLLMLSGIGPKLELEKHNINLLKDLPVGKHLKNHVIFPGLKITTNISIPEKSIDDHFREYLQKKGELTYPPGDIIRLLSIKSNSTIPDLEIFLEHVRLSLNNFGCKINNCNSTITSSNHNFPTFSSNIVLLHPKSTGDIRVASSDPIAFPIINPNYLKHRYDSEVLYQGVQEVKKLLQTDVFKKLNATLQIPDIQQCSNIKNEKQMWNCIFKYTVVGLHHPVGTCRMGRNSNTSVVDENLLVHGFTNLRVADASIIPKTLSGHTNAPAIMIGEKVSDTIKLKHLKQC